MLVGQDHFVEVGRDRLLQQELEQHFPGYHFVVDNDIEIGD